MSCDRVTCFPTISYSLPVPALAFARLGFFATRSRDLFAAVTRAQDHRETQKPFWQ